METGEDTSLQEICNAQELIPVLTANILMLNAARVGGIHLAASTVDRQEEKNMSSNASRAVAAALALAAIGAVSRAEFLKLDIREDKAPPPPAVAALIDPTGLGIRTFNFYGVFSGEGAFDGAARRNVLLAVGQPNATAGFGVNKESEPGSGVYDKNTSAYFYQTPSSMGGSNFAPLPDFIDPFPSLEWDSFVSIGLKRDNESDGTYVDPDFAWVDRDGDTRQDFIRGGWANVPPTNGQGFAALNLATNQYEVFFTQLTIVGLDAGASLGSALDQTTFQSDVFSGGFSIFRAGEGFEPSAVEIEISFTKVPGPGCASVLGVSAALYGLQRRRASAHTI